MKVPVQTRVRLFDERVVAVVREQEDVYAVDVAKALAVSYTRAKCALVRLHKAGVLQSAPRSAEAHGGRTGLARRYYRISK